MDSEEEFIKNCSEFVKEIENYSGKDPIEPWYKYLLWLDENFEMDFSETTIFSNIIAHFIERFQDKSSFTQDRRLIKAFIRYVITVKNVEFQIQHYQLMYQNNLGTKVADLYINWSFAYEQIDDYENVMRIIELGISAEAQPIMLLKRLQMNFKDIKEQRLAKNETNFWQKHDESLKLHLKFITTFRLDERFVPRKKSDILKTFDTLKLMKFCYPRIEEAIDDVPPTPRSASRCVMDSARKMALKNPKINNISGRSLKFNDEPIQKFDPIPLPPHENMFIRGIQLHDIVHQLHNRPQRIINIAPFLYEEHDFTEKLKTPINLIMLMPNANQAFSPEELAAYKWFKTNKKTNQFTKEYDKVWSNTNEAGIRWPVMFPSMNKPQPDWDVPAIGDGDYYTETREIIWGTKWKQHYPDEKTELSIEEIKWQKLKEDKLNQTNNNVEPMEEDLSTTITNINKSIDLAKQNPPFTVGNSMGFLIDDTMDFEMLEMQQYSPEVLNKTNFSSRASLSKMASIQNTTQKLETSTQSLNGTQNYSGNNYSIPITEFEHRHIVNDKNNPYLAQITMMESLSPINETDECEGKSIYVKQEEIEFREEDANWAEVTQFLLDGSIKNDYEPEEIDLNETTLKLDTFMINLCKMNPFETDFQKALLDKIGFVESLHGANDQNCVFMKIVQPLKPKQVFPILGRNFHVRKVIGSGSFGKVFSAECAVNKEMVALKQQRPPHLWEYYICLEIHRRINDANIRNGFMAIDAAIIGNNSTIYVSKFSKYGTLLNVCNKVKLATSKNIDEIVVMLLVKQMFTLVSNLHNAKIIHADLKPDNFLLMNKLSVNENGPEISVQLIDFGQSIDLKQFPSNQMFWSKVKTQNFICTEMMNDKPWSYQFDLFCLASTIYTLVAGIYMVVKRSSPTEPYKPQKLPRYVNATLWDKIFDALINIPDPKKMPNLNHLDELINVELEKLSTKKIFDAISLFNKALD